MNPVHLSITISCPREEVFRYLEDVANHPEFTDHYLTQWHLTRVDSVGKGAGARFRMKLPLNRFSWADMTVAEAEAPYRLQMVGRGGKYNRTKTHASWTLSPAPGNGTRVDYEFETEPALPSDRFMEALGARRRIRRAGGKALKRLQRILETGDDRGTRATVGGL